MSKTNPLEGIVEDPQLNRPTVSVRDFEDGTTGAVRVLGRTAGVEVVFAGDQAKTNGKQVVLPKLSDGKILSKNQVNAGRGYADHETLHNLLTDFKNGGRAMREAEEAGNPLLARMMNAIEDIRIENGGQHLYPGMQRHLDDVGGCVAKHFLEGIYAEDPTVVEDFRRIGPVAVTWAGRQALGYDNPYIEAALSTLPDAMRATVEKWAEVVTKLDTGVTGMGTIDVPAAHAGCVDGVELARLLTEKCVEEPKIPPPPDEPTNEPPTEPAPGEPTPTPPTGGEPEPRAGTEPTPPAGTEPEPKAGTEPTGTEPTPPTGTEPTGGEPTPPQGPPIDPGIKPAVTELLQQGTAGTVMKKYRTFSWAEDQIVGSKGVKGITHEHDENTLSDRNLKRYGVIVRQNSSRLGVMRRKIERALMAKMQSTWEGGHRRGKLSRRSLLQVVDGNNNVFRKKIEGARIDTALVILNDFSSSMCGSKVVLAGTASIAMAEALEGTGVSLEVAGFQQITRRYRDTKLNAAVVEAQRQGIYYDRTTGCTLFILKAFEQTLRQSRAAMGAMPSLARGLTPDGPVILMAWERLKRQPETKKVMLVMTDGHPQWDHTIARKQNYTRDAIQLCIDEGCEMIGIGIKHDLVRTLYPKWVVIHNINDLSKGVLDQVAQMLLGEHFKVDNGDLLKASGRDVKRSVA